MHALHAIRFFLVLMSAALALGSGAARAQPRLEADPRLDIAARGSAHYTFETVMLEAHGARRYRVQIARPRQAPPAAGHPAIFLLDGNAAVEALDEALLAELAAASAPPVIVAIGYDTPLRFDVVARAYDYTPPLTGGEPQPDPLDPARKNGGAVQFLDFIDDRVKPEVAARVPLDPARLGLWGHSYGGLFVLHTLLTRPGAFSDYVAASPALWWRDGHLLSLEADFAPALAGRRARLLVLRGEAEGRETRPGADAARLAQRQRAMAGLPAGALPDLVARLGSVPGLAAVYRELPGLEHGPMLPASVGVALRWMAGAGDAAEAAR